MSTNSLRANGFSAIELLITVGLLTFVTLTTASVMSQQWNQIGASDSKLGQISLIKDLQRELESSATCNSSLLTKKVDTALLAADRPIPAQFAIDGKNVMTDESLRANYGVDINGLELRDFRLVKNIGGTENRYLATLYMKSNARKGEHKATFAEKPITTLYVEIDSGDGSVSNCFAIQEATSVANEVCTGMGGTFNWDTESCDTAPIAANICLQMGGKFVAGKCTLAPSDSTGAGTGTGGTPGPAGGSGDYGKLTLNPTEVSNRVTIYFSNNKDVVSKVYCPAGKKRTGGGCRAGRKVDITSDNPPANGEGWRCVATWANAIPGEVRHITSYAICL